MLQGLSFDDSVIDLRLDKPINLQPQILQHSTPRLLNFNQLLSAFHNQNLNLNSPQSMAQTTGDSLHGLPSSAIESFYSDQSNNQAAVQNSATSNSDIRSLSSTSNAPNLKDSLDGHVRNILVPRVSGTPGNVKVRQVS